LYGWIETIKYTALSLRLPIPVKLIALYISLFAVALAITIMFLFPSWIVDDAFISFRYAGNLVNHSEFTWNVGEERVEGYTGLILPLLSALVVNFNFSPVTASHFIGIISFLSGILILFKLVRKIGFNPIYSSLILLFYCTMPIFFTHTWSGLETMLFSTSVLASIYFSISFLMSKNKRKIYNAGLLLFFLFTSLVRPEGVVLSFLLSLAIYQSEFRDNQKNGYKFLRYWIFIYLIPGLIYFIWRWNYYGDILPNTFYAKQYDGIFSSESFNSLIDFLLRYAAVPGILAVIFIALNRLLGTKNSPTQKSNKKFFNVYGASLIFLLIITIQYLHSNLLMNFSFRFFAPYYPVLIVGLFYLINRSSAYIFPLRKTQPMLFWVSVVVMSAATSSQLWINYADMKKEINFANRYKHLLESEHIPVGKLIKDIVPSTEWLIVDADAGAIPYYSGLKTIDCFKLNDKYLAKNRVDGKNLADYYYSFHPGVIVITSFDWDSVKHYVDAQLITTDPRFKNYSLYSKFKGLYWQYYEFVFFRIDLFAALPQKRALISSLNQRGF
jgi:arabinofuranosyltransferase